MCFKEYVITRTAISGVYEYAEHLMKGSPPLEDTVRIQLKTALLDGGERLEVPPSHEKTSKYFKVKLRCLSGDIVAIIAADTHDSAIGVCVGIWNVEYYDSRFPGHKKKPLNNGWKEKLATVEPTAPPTDGTDPAPTLSAVKEIMSTIPVAHDENAITTKGDPGMEWAVFAKGPRGWLASFCASKEEVQERVADCIEAGWEYKIYRQHEAKVRVVVDL